MHISTAEGDSWWTNHLLKILVGWWELCYCGLLCLKGDFTVLGADNIHPFTTQTVEEKSVLFSHPSPESFLFPFRAKLNCHWNLATCNKVWYLHSFVSINVSAVTKILQDSGGGFWSTVKDSFYHSVAMPKKETVIFQRIYSSLLDKILVINNYIRIRIYILFL